MRMVLATRNPGKIEELRQIMAGLAVELVSPVELGLDLDPIEDGLTFADNAALKARAYAKAAGLPALADDSGLEVDALGGRPGVMSARYAGEGASDADRRSLLLREMAEVPEERRTARFRCVMALLREGRLYTTEGAVEGRIAFAERGTGGFGYDPLFLLPSLGQTMAELAPAEKNTLSHRGKAARSMKALLAELLQVDDKA